MTELTKYYRELGIRDEVYQFGDEILDSLKGRFEEIDKVAEYNQLKVIQAMQKSQVNENCIHYYASGYGYNDPGRDTLEEVYASVFHTESALVRPQITCGTHALSLALSANLRPGDELLSPVGKPYDTLEEVIGIRPSRGSLSEYGITYSQVELLPDGTFDYEAIEKAVGSKTKLVTIQRSKGYLTRPSFSVKQIGELIAFVKKIKPEIICMVDNCYGEFVEVIEPSDVGADLVAGSLIKNLGGGLAPIGGYIAGRKDLIDACGYRLTSPGLGREVGASLGVMQTFYQGLFLRLWQEPLKELFLPRIFTKGLDIKSSRTVKRAGMILYRQWSLERRKVLSLSVRGYRQRRRWMLMWFRSPGPCRGMTAM